MFRRQRDCRWISCLLWVFTAALGLLLVVQIPFVLLFVFSREIHLPARWVEKVASGAIGDSYSVRLDSVTIDETGTLRFRDISLHGQNGRRVADADLLEVDLFLPSMFLGFPHPEEVSGENLRILDFQGPLGNPDPVASVERFRFVRKDLEWIIEDFRAYCGDLPLAASGRVGSDAWTAIAPGRDAPTDESLFARVPEAKAQMDRFKNPYLHLHLAPQDSGKTLARLTIVSDRAELPFDTSLAGNLRLTVDATIGAEGVHPGDIRLAAGELVQSDSFQADNLRLRLSPPPGFPEKALISGGRARFSARGITTAEGSLTYPTFLLKGREGLRFSAKGQAGLFDNPISIDAEIDPLRRTILARAAGLIDTDALLRHPRVPPEARKPLLDFGEGLFLLASTRFTLGEALPETIRFRAESGPMDIQGFRGLHARAAGEFDPGTLRMTVDSLSVQTEDYHMEGSYQHDLRNNQFRFLIRGGFLPEDINGWMRDWWDDLWKDFEIKRIPYVDLDLRGDWDHRDERWLFGGVRFEDLVLKNMELKHGHARLRSYPYLFELFDLRAFRPEGEIRGSMGTLIDPETRDETAEIYDFVSTVDFASLAPLFGKEIEEIVSVFALTTPPEVTIRGTLFPGEDEDERENLLIKARTDQPLTYRGISLDSLAFDGYYANGILRCEPIRFQLGGGSGEGWLIQRNPESEGGTHSAGLEFTGGDPHAVVDAIPLLREALGDRFEEKEEETREFRNLDFSIECSGDLDDPESLLGAGDIDLSTPNLANIRLLGIFSRISEELPLPFTLGSFQFERLSSSFLLNRGLIELSDLTLHSPSSRILASGAYDMKGGTIDFNARMHLLGETRIPILAQLGDLLNPVGRVFEFRVWGDPDDPDWRLYLDPRSWN